LYSALDAADNSARELTLRGVYLDIFEQKAMGLGCPLAHVGPADKSVDMTLNRVVSNRRQSPCFKVAAGLYFGGRKGAGATF
jgi:hypothetical protein